MNVLEGALLTGVKLVSLVSSRAVYAGWSLPGPVPEVEEISIHAGEYIQVTKKAGEILVLYYRRKLGLDVRILRLARVYGPLSRAARNPVREMVESASANRPAIIPNSPEERNDFVYVKDVVEVCMFLMEHRKNSGIYNLGSGKARTFLDLARNTFRAMNKEEKIEFVPTPEDIRDKYQYFTEADMSKLKSIGYPKEFTSLEDGIDDYVKNYLLKKAYY